MTALPEKKSSGWKSLLTWLIALAAISWVFHDVDLAQWMEHLIAMSWWWLLPAVACDIFSYLCDGIRWSLLLRPVGRLSVTRTTQAIYIALFTNEVIPMRVGEVVRAWLAAHWLNLSFSRILPSLLVSRLIDGVWLAAAIGALMIAIPLPESLLLAGDIFGLVLLALLIVFIALVGFRPAWTSRPVAVRLGGKRWLSKMASFLMQILEGISRIGEIRLLIMASFWSLALLFFQGMAFWLVMQSYHLPLSLWAGLAVFLIVHLGTAVPNAPANIGSFQFFTVLGLGLFGIDKTAAAGFSLVVFLALTLPLWIIGLLALSQSGFRLSDLRAVLRKTL